MTLEDRIRDYITSSIATDVHVNELPSDYDLTETGILDSLAIVRMIAWLGETFEIPVDDLDLAPDDFRTVGHIRDFVEKHTAGRSVVDQRSVPFRPGQRNGE